MEEECVILTSTSQSYVIWSQNKEFQVHNIPETTLLNGMDSLKHNYGGWFYSWCDICALMKCKVVSRDFNISALEQFIQLFESQVEIECLRVIKVVVSCVFVLIISTTNRTQSVSWWLSDEYWLTRAPCKTCLVQAAQFYQKKRPWFDHKGLSCQRLCHQWCQWVEVSPISVLIFACWPFDFEY